MSKMGWKQLYWSMRVERLVVHAEGVTVEGRCLAGGTVSMGPRQFELAGAKESPFSLGEVVTFSCFAKSPATMSDPEVAKMVAERVLGLVEVKP